MVKEASGIYGFSFYFFCILRILFCTVSRRIGVRWKQGKRKSRRKGRADGKKKKRKGEI
jgi:hypothetical protein